MNDRIFKMPKQLNEQICEAQRKYWRGDLVPKPEDYVPRQELGQDKNDCRE